MTPSDQLISFSRKMRIILAFFLGFILASVAALGQAGANGGNCESLLRAQLPHTVITTAESVAAGKFVPPAGRPLDKVSAFCRGGGVIKPTDDS